MVRAVAAPYQPASDLRRSRIPTTRCEDGQTSCFGWVCVALRELQAAIQARRTEQRCAEPLPGAGDRTSQRRRARSRHAAAMNIVRSADNLPPLVDGGYDHENETEQLLLTGLPSLARSHRKSSLHRLEREESRLAIRGNPRNRFARKSPLQRPKSGKFDYLCAPSH